MGLPALAVVREHLDHAARPHMAMAAPFDHRFQFRFERDEAREPLVHVGQARPGDPIGARAGLGWIVLQDQERSNGLDLEAKFARVANERQSTHVDIIILAPVPLIAVRHRQQADLLIIADGRDFHPAVLGRFANRQALQHGACSSSR